MINTIKLFSFLSKKIKFITGVPDSNLKYLINLFGNKKIQHYICANEGSAVAMGAGYFLSSKKIPAVYMQNSGLSNALNPLLSICHSKVYSIPMLLIIGWRGSPGTKDEPQHQVKGLITRDLLKLAGIKSLVLKKDTDINKISELLKYSKKKNKSVAILIRNNFLSKTMSPNKSNKFNNVNSLIRSHVIRELCSQIKSKTYLVSNTGYASRELDKTLKEMNNKFIKPFYMIGGMGHTSMLALSNALNKNNYNTICLDGDGSIIMHLGSLISVGNMKLKNFKHIVLNNNQHESVGGQSTNLESISLLNFAKNSGYKVLLSCQNKRHLKVSIKRFLESKQLTFLEVKTIPFVSNNLGRPKNFIKIKKNFMK